MDSECACGCTWSTARATARLWDRRPWSSQTGQVIQGLRRHDQTTFGPTEGRWREARRRHQRQPPPPLCTVRHTHRHSGGGGGSAPAVRPGPSWHNADTPSPRTHTDTETRALCPVGARRRDADGVLQAGLHHLLLVPRGLPIRECFVGMSASGPAPLPRGSGRRPCGAFFPSSCAPPPPPSPALTAPSGPSPTAIRFPPTAIGWRPV